MEVTPTQLLSRSRKHATVLLATALFAGHVFAAEPKAGAHGGAGPGRAGPLLTVTETRQPPRKLQPLSPTRFLGPVEITPLRFEFLRNARGVVYALVAERGNAKAYFRRDAAKVVTQ